MEGSQIHLDQYGIWRMATSLVLVARQNKLSAEIQKEAVDAFARSYLTRLTSDAGNEKALSTYFTKRNTSKTLKKFLKQVEQENNRKVMLKKWTSRKRGKRYFALTPEMKPPVRVTQKLAPISQSERIAILNAMPGYGKTLKGRVQNHKDYLKVEDIAQRLLAGTGSRGTPRYYVLIKGKGRKDDHILDIKLQSKPTAYHFLSEQAQKEFDSCYPNAADRHAAA